MTGIRSPLALAVLTVAVALAACASDSAKSGAGQPQAARTTAGTCHVRGAAPRLLPDPACTPGATNPAVTQATIAATICTPGWATRQRPPVSWTEPRKAKAVRAYGYYAGKSLKVYKYDHLVPLSVGGAPQDERNLWVQEATSSKLKDRVEAKVHAAVCAGKMTLAAAQAGFMRDWTRLG